MAVIDQDKISEILRVCAAEHIMPRYQALRDDEVSSKTSPLDLVTQADIDAEAYLERVLPDMYPGTLVMGEEGVSRGDVPLDMLTQVDEPVWVVDPVDGTYNFVHGRPEFGVMLAYVVAGEVQHGWIYHPLQEEMYVAERGAGGFVGTQRLAVSDVRDSGEMTALMNTKFFPDAVRPVIEERSSQFKSCIRLGAASHQYTRVASGQSDVVVYSRLKPWDHLPGALLVREAGGVVRKWDGQDYGVSDLYAGLLIANSEENWQSVYSLLFDGIDVEQYFTRKS